jgi:hypothetical protein
MLILIYDLGSVVSHFFERNYCLQKSLVVLVKEAHFMRVAIQPAMSIK